MRELIRPALFMVARMGLLLAVLTWAVAPELSLSFLVPLPTGMGGAELTRDGWHCRQISNRIYMSIGEIVCTPYSPSGVVVTHEKFKLLSQTRFIQKLKTHPSTFCFSDSTEAPDTPGWREYVLVSHWLIVTVFALFYGVLKWVYRKRATEVDHG